MEIDGPLGTVATVEIPAGEAWLSDWLPLGECTVAQQAASSVTTYAPGQTVSLAQDGATAVVNLSNAYQQRDDDGDDDQDYSQDRNVSDTDHGSDFPVSEPISLPARWGWACSSSALRARP